MAWMRFLWPWLQPYWARFLDFPKVLCDHLEGVDMIVLNFLTLSSRSKFSSHVFLTICSGSILLSKPCLLEVKVSILAVRHSTWFR
ncbi:unnamed protein product [Acidithrix sp. C25]|nr:unnamed protein product [Acidithrix sp. C25]